MLAETPTAVPTLHREADRRLPIIGPRRHVYFVSILVNVAFVRRKVRFVGPCAANAVQVLLRAQLPGPRRAAKDGRAPGVILGTAGAVVVTYAVSGSDL